MIERRTERPPKPRSRPSGENKAVQAYRAKLDSVDKNVCEATSRLDRELKQFLIDLKTPVPPKISEEEAAEVEEIPHPPPPRQ